MRERPVLFSDEMVRAILAGSKTMTRRVVKPQPKFLRPPTRAGLVQADIGSKSWWLNSQPDHPCHIGRACPHGQPGDRLWMREAWAPHADDSLLWLKGREMEADIFYRADGGLWPYQDRAKGRGWYVPEGDPFVNNWRPSIHMPRWASRLTLEIAEVRVQRLQEISEEDAIAEGTPWARNLDAPGAAIGNFATLWDSINGKRAPWDSNPWIWAISFRRVSP